MDVKDVYCICGQPYDKEQFMIQCDSCREWYHGSCVGVREYVSVDLDKYHCLHCELTVGPSQFKKQFNWHRHDYSDPNADKKPVQTGTPVFIKELKTRHFHSAENVLLKLEGHEFNMAYLYQHGFDQPVMIEQTDGLEMLVPPDNFTVHDVERLVGSDRQVDVIDVCRQSDIRMRVGDFVSYFTNPKRLRILNLISLEFSNTKLSDLVMAPYIARELDWVNSIWPDDLDSEEEEETKKPEVQKYCLIGVQDSYTDFHIDFGGTSVWYHVLKGEKIFYLIKPTHANLSLYQRWMTSSTQYETFFADQVDICYKCTVRAGNTMLIPTGWIHAVLTPKDSIVFGGNFLHSLNIPMQLQIYEIEKKIRTPEKFKFPGFETINWYAARRLCEELKQINEQGTKVPNYLLVGLKALLYTLKQWNQDKDTNKSRREKIPVSVQGPKLLKDLSKEIRHAERYLNSLNPPKPERESKRKKRKPVTTELKEPLKLSIKVINNKKFQLNQEENGIKTLPSPTPAPPPPPSRPSLKLTLPKPVTYPYVTVPLNNVNTNNTNNIPVTVKEENKNWFVSVTNSPHVKMKKEGELKVKLAVKQELPRPFDTEITKTIKTNSVYDFHDDSEDIDDEDDNCLTIDENPKKKTSWNNNKSSNDPLYVKFTAPEQRTQLSLSSVLMNFKPSSGVGSEMDIGGEVDVVSDLPKNGIEELLKASCYTREPSPKIEDIVHEVSVCAKEQLTWSTLSTCNSIVKATPDQTGNRSGPTGPASPSTREAIAGMLSISQSNHSRPFLMDPTSSGSGAQTVSAGTKAKRKKAPAVQDDFEENINKVHQDDDFIYPSLDLSDDEEIPTPPRAGKRKIDEAWSPTARVGHVQPKKDRPLREGTRKQSVEKGLEAAAARRTGPLLAKPAKRPYRRKKPKRQTESTQSNVAVATAGSSSQIDISAPSCSTQSLIGPSLNSCNSSSSTSSLPSTSSSPSLHPHIKPFSVDSKSKKPKKGMATAKQRLGKILKIHKMIH